MKKYIVFCLLIAFCTGFAHAQYTNTFYFMEEIPTRSDVNPAFMPNCKWYFDIPILPSFYVGLGNNAFTLRDGIYIKGDQVVTAFHSSQNVDDLFGRAKRINSLDAGFALKLLNFGFATPKGGYFVFDASYKLNAEVYIPRDLVRFGLYGTPDEFGVNRYNLKRFGINSALYGEIGAGYMHQLNEQWTIGGRLKFLIGFASVYTKVNQLQFEASKDSWKGYADASVYSSMPVEYGYTSNHNIDLETATPIRSEWFMMHDSTAILPKKPSGFGAGVDVGVSFKPIEALTLSAAVTDLSFIRWGRNLIYGEMKGDTVFTGIDYKYGDTIKIKQIGQDFADAFQMHSDRNRKYTQMLTGNINFGIEYGFLDNKISLGALSHTHFSTHQIFEEVTLAANFRPTEWLKAYLSYSFVNSRWNNIGLGLNLRMGAVNTFIVADYIPCSWAHITREKNGTDVSTMTVPYRSQRVNLQAGMTFNFGRASSDRDRDGVANRKDKCPNTDINRLMVLCPDVKRKNFVDENGCELDEDKDGVHDCYDKCPGTPAGVQVDEKGCPVDTDKDGVPDYLDQCSDTPEGVQVDEKGCPIDTDKDGVPDYLDQCPETPEGTPVDKVGCPLDSDGDGVTDDKDKCPDTPTGVAVDEKGCPIDSDGDGVPDYLDKCPNTPEEARGYLDEFGCPKDKDGDGVYDYEDRCPEVPGTRSNNGCPELKAAVKRLFKQALHGIQFETGKSTIKPVSFPILNKVVEVMNDNPDFLLNIAGHTDSQGADDMNQKLSEDRANAVKDYLAKKGVAADRMTAEGFGETKPIDTNATAAGRRENRRVEFTVSFLR